MPRSNDGDATDWQHQDSRGLRWPEGPCSFHAASLLPGVGVNENSSQDSTFSYQANRIKSMTSLGAISWVVSGSMGQKVSFKDILGRCSVSDLCPSSLEPQKAIGGSGVGH